MSELLSSPIPGENLVQDSRNYAWHKPAQLANYDEAFEYFVDSYIADRDRIVSAMVMAENGISVRTMIVSACIGMVSRGIISPDMSLILAGPMYMLLTGTLDNLGIHYMTGKETSSEIEKFYQKLSKATKKPKSLSTKQIEQFDALQKELEEVELPSGGLMGSPDSTEPVIIPKERTGVSLVTKPSAEGIMQ